MTAIPNPYEMGALLTCGTCRSDSCYCLMCQSQMSPIWRSLALHAVCNGFMVVLVTCSTCQNNSCICQGKRCVSKYIPICNCLTLII